jgi:hypothetical protein
MKINLTDDLKKDGLISHIVLNSISETTMDALLKAGSIQGVGNGPTAVPRCAELQRIELTTEKKGKENGVEKTI